MPSSQTWWWIGIGTGVTALAATGSVLIYRGRKRDRPEIDRPRPKDLTLGPFQTVPVDPFWKPPVDDDDWVGTKLFRSQSEVDVDPGEEKLMDVHVATLGDTEHTLYVHACLSDWPTITNSPDPYFLHGADVFEIQNLGYPNGFEKANLPWNTSGCPKEQKERPDWPPNLGDGVVGGPNVQFVLFGRELHARIYVSADNPRRFRFWARGRPTPP